MITVNNIAKAETTINAQAGNVWDALINPDMIRKYMFGATVISDWKEGSKIVGKANGKGNLMKTKEKFF